MFYDEPATMTDAKRARFLKLLAKGRLNGAAVAGEGPRSCTVAQAVRVPYAWLGCGGKVMD